MTAARMKMGGCKDEDVMATAIRVLHEHATATVAPTCYRYCRAEASCAYFFAQ